jgi:hypothetical protein
MREKIEHQRRLRKACEESESPANYPWFNPFDERWWCQPEGVSPDYQRRQIERQIKRMQRNGR